MNPGLMFDAMVVLPSGIGLTLTLTVLSLTAGFLLAVPLAFIRAFGAPSLSAAVLAYTYVTRGTPMLVQLFLIYYGLGQIEAVRASVFWVTLRDPFYCAVLTFSLNSAAHTTEILARGLQSVPKGIMEAAAALGLKRFQTARLVTFPIAFRISLPAYGNEVVGMIKGSSLASTVTLLEITGMARQMEATTFAPYEIFIVAGAIYLALTSIAVKAMQLLERWLLTEGHPAHRRRPRFLPAAPDHEITTPLPRRCGLGCHFIETNEEVHHAHTLSYCHFHRILDVGVARKRAERARHIDRFRRRVAALGRHRRKRPALRIRHRRRTGAVPSRPDQMHLRPAGLGRHHPGAACRQVRCHHVRHGDHREAQAVNRLLHSLRQRLQPVHRAQGPGTRPRRR